MSFSDLKTIVSDFISETGEILRQVDRDLVELESRPDDIETVNNIFRSIHTVKGSASFLGFTDMVVIIHGVETILNRIRQNELTITPEVNDELLGLLDSARETLEKIRESSSAIAPLGGDAAEGEAGESFITEDERRPAAAAEPTVRVQVSRLNTLVNLVGELVQSRNQLLRLAAGEERKRESGPEALRLMEAAEKINRVTADLQRAVMSARMLPMKKVFSVFPRLVRDIAGGQGKEARLDLQGENTEVDRSVIEVLQDSLVHLVRNAIDHGIEPPEERTRKNKPREGIISIRAAYEGNSVVVTVSDDGRGIDLEAVLQSAVDHDLVSIERAPLLSSAEIMNFVFAPGFTTRRETGLTSGRGVGLDVVMSNVTRMNGSISLDSTPGRGCEIKIKTPLTLAISQALIVGVGGETFALPAAAVEETARIGKSEIQTIDGREVMEIRGHALPVARLSRLFGVPSIHGRWMYAAVARIAEKRFGLLVDSLHGQEEIVIKPINGYLSIRGIAGGTILGDGRVALIVDMGEMAEMAMEKRQAAPASPGEGLGAGLRALVADASATARRSGRQSLEEAGYAVAEAASADEVLRLMRESEKPFDIVILDAALPEPGGIRAAERIKNDAALKKTPVVILTSPGEDVDTDYGFHIGVEDFLAKQELGSLPAAVLRHIVR